MIKFSIIIPAYNEEARIAKTLSEIDGYFICQNYNYEIIVVNDGSKDKTLQIVEDLKNRVKNLSVIDNPKNLGKGFVVRQGLLSANGQYRLFTDADNSTQINQIEKFLPYLEKYDIIIGSRRAKGAVLNPAQPWHRKILGKFFNFLVAAIVGQLGIKDSQCGFKLLSQEAINDILPKCKINGWAFDVEVLLLAKKTGYKIIEVPIIWNNNTKSKVKLNGMAKSIIELLKIRWFLISQKYKI